MIHRGVEQLAARRAHNPEVGGSSPPPATIEEILEGFLFFYGSGGRTDVLNHIYIPPKSPFGKGGFVARLCLALLRNMNSRLNVVDISVRNFDMESYLKGETFVSPFFRSGGRTCVLNHIYIPPKSPFGKGGLVARLCLALLRNMNSRLNVVDISVRNCSAFALIATLIREDLWQDLVLHCFAI